MNREINFLAAMIAKHGAWSLFRLGWPGGDVVSTMCRGGTLSISQKLYRAAVNATFNEANRGRWFAVAQFRKEVI